MARIRQAAAVFTCTIWAMAGLAIPLLLLHTPSWPKLDTLLFVLGSIALATCFSYGRFEFRSGKATLDIAPDSVFIVLAAVLLPPPGAAFVALLGSIWSVRRAYARWSIPFQLANASFAAGIASAVTHAALGEGITARAVLPAALLAAGSLAGLTLLGQLVYEEANSPGGGVALIRHTPLLAVALLEIGLPASAVAMTSPFLNSRLLAFAVASGFAGFAWIVLRMLHDEFRQRQQNDYLRDTVSRYMPRPVANQLLTSNEQVELGGDQYEITVMFCDIRNFTSWSEQNEPDDVIAQLNVLLTLLSDAVIATEGTLDKFTGDGMMAFWGAPNEQLDHAARAMRAVPQIMMRVREFNMQREAEGKPVLEVGIGINSGLAMVGNVGHKDRLNYTAVGDTVNLAARLEAQTKAVGCPLLISESTFLSLPFQMQKQCARMESITVKGRRDRVRLFTLTSLAKYRMQQSHTA